MTQFNQHSPCAIGCEWFPPIEAVARLSGDLQVAGAILESTAAESIGFVEVGLTGNAGRTSGWELEIYDASDLPGANTLVQTYRPGCDVLKVDSYGWDGATLQTPADTLYVLIDEATLTPGTYNGRSVPDTDWIAPIFGAGAEYSCRFDSLAGTLTNRNIVRVRLRAKVSELVSEYLVEGGVFVPYLTIGGKQFFGSPRSVVGQGTAFDPAEDLTFDWWANPATGVSWKPQDLDDFDCATGGADSSAGWIIKPTGSSNNLAVIFQGYLQVQYLDEVDKRLAVGTLTDPGGQVGWHSMTITAPDGTANWAKADTTEYLFLLRRRVGSGYIDWRFLLDPQYPNGLQDPEWRMVTPRLYQSLLTLAEVGATQAGAFAILLVEPDGTTVSLDSQPYLSINDDGGPGANTLFQHFWTRVNSAQNLEQELTVPGLEDYGVVRFLTAWEVSEPTADLTVELRRRSDNVQFGTTLTVTAAEVAALAAGNDSAPTMFQTFEAEIPGGPVALAADQYYLLFQSTAPQGEAWRVQVLSTLIDTEPGGPPVDAYGATFNGTTDVAEVDGTEYPSLDAACTIHTQPDPPATLTASLSVVSGCLDEVALTWTPTDVGAEGCGAFVRYEIERSDTTDTAWQRIAQVSTEATAAWDDQEARREVESTYRIRVRRDDNSFSSWTESDPVTRGVGGCCGFILASNEAPDYSIWVDDTDLRRWSFPEERTITEFYGRDFAVWAGTLEESGEEFEVEFIVASDGGEGGTGPASVLGLREFDPVRWICSNSKVPALGTKLALSYVAVLDSYGNRWFASVQVLDATYDARGGNTHWIRARIRTATTRPSIAEIP